MRRAHPQTGSVARTNPARADVRCRFTTASCGDRAARQLLRDLPAAFQLTAKVRPRLSEHDSFITGPSRTGDIERILVLGAARAEELTISVFEHGKFSIQILRSRNRRRQSNRIARELIALVMWQKKEDAVLFDKYCE